MPAPDDNELITAARRWYDAGFCVIPSHEDGGKRPFGAWKEYQEQRPDWNKLSGWLGTGKYTGIGLIMGKASGNAEMMEIEGPKVDLAPRLDAVVAQASKYKDIGLDDLLKRVILGFSETSAGGGLHIIIRITDGPALGNTKLAHADGKVVAETRGEGGFVIVWPTPARTGHDPDAAYVIEWGSPDTVAEVTSDDRDLLHLAFSLGLNKDHEPVATTKPAPSPPQVGLSTFDDYRARVTWASILKSAGWTYHSKDAEHDYWVRPGKSPREGNSASTIDDGPLYLFSTSMPAHWPVEVGLSKAQVYALIHHGGDLSAAARDLAGQGYGDGVTYDDLPPWIINPPAMDTVDGIEPTEEELRDAYVHEHLPAIDWDALWADETEEEWIVYPLLPARRLVALYSAPKVGKSLLMLELAAGIAAGRALFGNATQEPRTVLYVDYENDPKADIRERLTNMGYTPDTLRRLKLLSFPTMSTLDSEKGSLELMGAVQAYKATVVIIDTVSRAIEGDENENDTWLDFYRHTGLKLKQAQIALVRLDHSGKDESKGQRGGSAKGGDVDAVWRMSKASDDLYDLVCEMNRMPIDPESRALTLQRMEGDTLSHVVKGDRIRVKREAMDAAIAACGPYPEGQRNWKAVKSAVLKRHQIKARNDIWRAAVGRYMVVPEFGDHGAKTGTA